MATAILDKDEILLNSVYYKIRGPVRPKMVSVLPGRVVVGDPSQSDEPVADAWIISDQRGGIGVHEMDEKVHKDRCAMSTCDLRFKGHNVLPRLVSEAKKPPTPSSSRSDGSGDVAWSDVTESYDEDTTTGADVALNQQESDYLELTYTAHDCANLRLLMRGSRAAESGDSISIEAYYDANGGAAWHVLENDYSNITWSSSPADGDEWNTIAIGSTESVTKIRLKFTGGAGGGAINLAVYEFSTDGVGTSLGAALGGVENFNSELFFAGGANVYKFDSTNKDRIVLLRTLDGTVTHMTIGPGGVLYVAVGDGTNYWYMSTTYGFTQTNKDAHLFVEWDSKLFFCDSLGQIYELTNPATATPTETTKGSLADVGVADNDLTSLITDADAAGTVIIYAATKKGLFAHDYANTLWQKTELSLPNHPNGGKGCAKWREYLHISSGLDMARYIAAETAIIDFTKGLSRDDGLLAYNTGEIVKFIPSFNELFALVDSSQTSGTSEYSTVMSWDGRGWQCAWEAATADDVMTTGIVSSVGNYCLWFDHDSKLYYMPIDRNLTNPKQKPLVHTYHAASVHIGPWFDADWAGNKIALAVEIYTTHPSTSETITPKYRINYTNIDRDTGWTTLGSAITASGLKTVEFSSSYGLAHKAIQFRWDLARGGTATSSPDLLYLKFIYLRQPKIAWAYRVDIDVMQDYRGKSPETLLDAIRTCTSKTNLAAFYYNDTIHYVYVKTVGGQESTGSNEEGVYSLLLVEPY